ncbi:MAG: metallophosphoesterase [Actinomycetota bacterium]
MTIGPYRPKESKAGRGAVLVLTALVLASCAGSGRSHGGDRPSGALRTPLPVETDLIPAPVETRFVVIGDFGTGRTTQHRVGETMCSWRVTHPFDLVVTTGDNIYPDGDPSRFQNRFKEPFACLLERGVRFRSSLGNHDIVTDNGRGEIADPAFGMRARNYVVRQGGVRFVIFDSNRLNMSWLRRALRSRDGDRWTVAVFHHPVFSPGTGHSSTPGFRPALPRLFRRRGVDLVLNGHDHVYAVSEPLRRIRYVVTGGGGGRLYGCDPRWFTDVCVARHHFLDVVASRDEIVVTAVAQDGRVFDRFRTTGR